MYVLVFVFHCFPPLPALHSLLPPPASFVWLRWKLNRAELDLCCLIHINTHTHTWTNTPADAPCVVPHVPISSRSYRNKTYRAVWMCITLCFVCVLYEKWKFLLFLLDLKVRRTGLGEFSKHVKASKSFPITFSHAGFKIIVHNALHYTSASGWELIRSFNSFFLHLLCSFCLPSGPHWGVSEEDWGQRGSHLHQQRHGLLHGSPHPHPSTSSFFFAGMLMASSVTICVWDLCNQNSCYCSHCLQIVTLLISFIKLKAVMYFPLKSTRSSPSFLWGCQAVVPVSVQIAAEVRVTESDCMCEWVFLDRLASVFCVQELSWGSYCLCGRFEKQQTVWCRCACMRV